MTRNSSGNFDGLRICFNYASVVTHNDEVIMLCNDVNLHEIFAQLTAEELVSLIPDQSTLKEVRDLLC